MNLSRNEVARDVSTGEGTASITATHPSAEIRALSPAIAKAYAAFEAANAAAAPLKADRQRLRRDLKALRDGKHPAKEYDQALDDELGRELARLDAALTRNANAARKLAVDYLLAVIENPRRDEARQDAAKLALAAHEDAVAALAALEDALARREKFYGGAGRPAEWKHHTHTLDVAHRQGRIRQSHELLAREVAEFPAGDVQTLADGGTVPTLAELQAAAERAEAERVASMKAAARARDRRRDIAEENAN
ncbi:hypothetical protein AB4Y72_16370 [Arthrobacter sp. YAF34]|uniref:hypothetical protein n=1 Tax=Arthrobacter sp. YAF34 TaxID=3233083 RepID=UPI003F92745A